MINNVSRKTNFQDLIATPTPFLSLEKIQDPDKYFRYDISINFISIFL